MEAASQYQSSRAEEIRIANERLRHQLEEVRANRSNVLAQRVDVVMEDMGLDYSPCSKNLTKTTGHYSCPQGQGQRARYWGLLHPQD